MKLEKELLDHTLDDAFTNLFDEVKKSRKNVCVAVCVTDGKDAAKPEWLCTADRMMCSQQSAWLSMSTPRGRISLLPRFY